MAAATFWDWHAKGTVEAGLIVLQMADISKLRLGGAGKGDDATSKVG